MDTATIASLLGAARADHREALLETEGLRLLAALGLPAPRHVFVTSPDAVTAGALDDLPGSRVVVKVVSPLILHKSDVGGVAIVDKTPALVQAAVADMAARLGSQQVAGYTISEFVPYPAALGHELIVGLRWTEDLGAVVSVGAGGIYTEFLAGHFRPGHDIAVFAPGLATRESIAADLGNVAVVQLMTRSLRGQPPRLALAALVDVVERFLAFAGAFGRELVECEVNPFVVAADGRLVALDILVKTCPPRGAAGSLPRPLGKLAHLLRPASAAIMGVSERLNPGHIIVNNLLREGFDRSRIHIVKAGSREIEGCVCVPDIASLPERVDLFVLAIDATQASRVLVEIIERRAAESVVLIPGGLEEKAGSEALVARMRDALAAARASDWGGPLINGGNCLGIRSLPGRYDTTFIPEHKFPVPAGAPSRVAFISQSGAFALSKASKLAGVNPKYSVTLGNQMDLTVGDYLTYLEDDGEIDLFAVYVEGFRPLDGLRFLEAAGRIVASGRTVILYRAGRTAAGAKASASHTASIAGDYAVIRALCQSAGVVVAETLEDFEDLTRLFAGLGRIAAPGPRLAAVSNAGFECVAIADNLGRFTLPGFGDHARRHLHDVFETNRIAQVVDLNNPIDLTPMTGDAGYVQTVEALLQEDDIDVVLAGCVPFTSAMQTLPRADHHGEDLLADTGIVSGLSRLHREYRKPCVAVIDAGPLYDPMADALRAAGVPTFRTADRALRLLNVFCSARERAGRVEAGPA
jgi:acyl-CoA synthetase (NDP forming)